MINNGEFIKVVFGEGKEEERRQFEEEARKLNIRDNDAIWTIVYVLNYFGRFYAGLPKEILDSKQQLLDTVEIESKKTVEEQVAASNDILAAAVVDSANKIAQRQSMVSYLTTSTFFCIGIFCLCLISFVAGSAVAGKGWGHSPVSALLNVPAGWIVPISLVPISIYRGIYAYRAFIANTAKRSELGWLCGCVFMVLLAGLMLLYVL